ncbi:DUF1015 domain-containing protein [Nonomuraea sp. MCN248]|uniref:DUF1015 domain-containing protein n=1 Tax=Nonomuraea corallina TaxID=2989783 RepID=A0ABT4SKP4_9ACTN|nr:DUF1015 domain-containing protein [Nonomuraea corallina]MDA0637754.1 DUF1015 domain-containing protein [Nonomuraea corallina]
MGNSELPIPDGLILRPFRGVRFAVDDPAKVTSPPYDLISDGDVRALLDVHPNNVVRLILPLSPGTDARKIPTEHRSAEQRTSQETDKSQSSAQKAPDPRYAEARRTLQAWLDAGVLVPDEEPALYVYEQRGPGVLQRGLIGDVCLPDPAQRIVLPHEDVLPGPIADRLALMSTTQANLEPIFLLYNGQNGVATRLVDEVATGRPPMVTAHTEDGLTHRLWAITDEAEIAAVNADLLPRQALIADGHHRYATYRILQRREHALHPTLVPPSQSRTGQPEPTGPRQATVDEAAGPEPTAGHRDEPGPDERDSRTGHREPPSGRENAGRDALDSEQPPEPVKRSPWDFGLALLVDTDAYPPELKAIHRVIPRLPLDEAVARAKGSWRVQDFTDLDEGLAALHDAEGPAFLLACGADVHLLSNPDPLQLAQAMPADRSARWNSLNTSILTEFVLPKVWGLRDDEETVRIVHHDPRAAAELAGTTGGTAVILEPLAVADVLAVAAGGERVPRKSTSFGPKPRTGLILRTFAIR